MFSVTSTKIQCDILYQGNTGKRIKCQTKKMLPQKDQDKLSKGKLPFVALEEELLHVLLLTQLHMKMLTTQQPETKNERKIQGIVKIMAL